MRITKPNKRALSLSYAKRKLEIFISTTYKKKAQLAVAFFDTSLRIGACMMHFLVFKYASDMYARYASSVSSAPTA